jgi:CheY-like chemotaxis protein
MSVILYIDDDELVCRSIALVLDDCDHELITMSDPRAAVDYINESPPDLVVCDYRMPELDGLAVLREIEVDVPFVLISGYLRVEVPDDPRLVKVLSKPVRSEQLLDVVESFAEAR